MYLERMKACLAVEKAQEKKPETLAHNNSERQFFWWANEFAETIRETLTVFVVGGMTQRKIAKASKQKGLERTAWALN